MSRTSKIIFGGLAAGATFAVMQMAAGETVSRPTLADRFEALAATTGTSGIDREAKSDRLTGPTRVGAGRTVLLRVEGLTDTSVLLRIPAAAENETRNLAPASSFGKPSDPKTRKMLACEPVVSVLTDVAKLLQPGKCIT